MKHRRPDSYYIDLYDRHTIEILKEIERKHTSDDISGALSLQFLLREKGIHRARQKTIAIQRWMTDDELKDDLISETPIPKDIRCNQCNSKMQFEGHLIEDLTVLFLFKCPNGHLPKKIVYRDGTEQYVPEVKCPTCGGKISTQTIQSENNITIVETCTACGRIEKDEISKTPKQEQPISEEDRLRYCSFSPKNQTLIEAMVEIENFMRFMEEHEQKKTIDLSKIEKLTIPQLEQQLNAVVTKQGYIKLEFEKPEFKSFVSIKFSVQDPTERNADESIKTLSRAIKREVFKTNWRLMSKGISYRLGYLDGQLRAYESEEDLGKIAQEIDKKIISKSTQSGRSFDIVID